MTRETFTNLQRSLNSSLGIYEENCIAVFVKIGAIHLVMLSASIASQSVYSHVKEVTYEQHNPSLAEVTHGRTISYDPILRL